MRIYLDLWNKDNRDNDTVQTLLCPHPLGTWVPGVGT